MVTRRKPDFIIGGAGDIKNATHIVETFWQATEIAKGSRKYKQLKDMIYLAGSTNAKSLLVISARAMEFPADLALLARSQKVTVTMQSPFPSVLRAILHGLFGVTTVGNAIWDDELETEVQ